MPVAIGFHLGLCGEGPGSGLCLFGHAAATVFSLFTSFSSRFPRSRPRRVVILSNSRQPESVQLAEFYAEKRAVPAANILALPLPEAEDITWREFIDQVWQPVQDELYKRRWIEGTASSLLDRLGRRRYAFSGNRISYLVVCRGVPLRIYNDPTLLEEKVGRKINPELNKNEAAVDSELSLLATEPMRQPDRCNPLFANDRTPSFNVRMVVKVSRLDGPTWESARLVRRRWKPNAPGCWAPLCRSQGAGRRGDQWLEATAHQAGTWF